MELVFLYAAPLYPYPHKKKVLAVLGSHLYCLTFLRYEFLLFDSRGVSLGTEVVLKLNLF